MTIHFRYTVLQHTYTLPLTLDKLYYNTHKHGRSHYIRSTTTHIYMAAQFRYTLQQHTYTWPFTLDTLYYNTHIHGRSP